MRHRADRSRHARASHMDQYKAMVDSATVAYRRWRARWQKGTQMKLRKSAVLTAILLLTAAASAVADGDAAMGRKKAETCMGCHAIPGYFNVYPSYHVPKLGGQAGKYIESALKQYRDGGRQHDTMHANAANLSDQDMADIGAYIESYRK